MADTPSLGVEELHDALWALVAPGASLARVIEQPVLLDLAATFDPSIASAEDASVGARDAVIAACRSIDDRALVVEPRWHGEGAAVLVLLGLATGFHSAPHYRRREGAASLLGYEVETAFKTRPNVRSHAQNAVYAVADYLWGRAIRARAQRAGQTAAANRPQLAALNVELLQRYEAYYTMYTPLSALRADLTAALELHRDGDDELNRFEDFVSSSLHAYSTFLIAKRDFIERYGGVWIFGQADIEQAMADSIKLIEHFSGLRAREESVLRLSAAGGELHTFASALEADTEGRAGLSRWRDRITSCHCDLEHPTDPCRVHKLLRATDYFTSTLDIDWYRMIPWHGVTPPNLDVIDPATLYRDVGLPAPES
jgi:hypothetical protein